MDNQLSDLDDYNGLNVDPDHLEACIARGTAQLVRVSSKKQLNSVGSIRLQESQREFLIELGVPADEIRRYILLGESAKDPQRRPKYQQVLRDTRAGLIGLLAVVDPDRAARNMADGEALFDALARVGGLLVVNGSFYDPANHIHRLMLNISIVVARFESDQRAFRSGMSRLAKARVLSAQIRPAVGILWADPDDPTYRERLAEYDLDYHVSAERLALHKERAVGKDGVRRLLLPVPDPEVQSALLLVLAWLLETRSLATVIERIRTDPRWPRPGHFPHALHWVWDPNKEMVEWVALFVTQDGVEHGRTDLARTKVYDWLRAASVFGIYRFVTSHAKEADRLAKRTQKEAEPGRFRS